MLFIPKTQLYSKILMYSLLLLSISLPVLPSKNQTMLQRRNTEPLKNNNAKQGPSSQPDKISTPPNTNDQNQNEKFKLQINKLQEEIETLKEENNKLENEIDNINESYKNSQQELETEKDNQTRMTLENDELQRANKDLESEVESLKNDISVWSDKNEILRRENFNLNSQIERYDNIKNQPTKSPIYSSHSINGNGSQDSDTEKLTSSPNQLEDLQKQIKDLSEKNMLLTQKCEELTKENKNLKSQSGEKSEEIGILLERQKTSEFNMQRESQYNQQLANDLHKFKTYTKEQDKIMNSNSNAAKSEEIITLNISYKKRSSIEMKDDDLSTNMNSSYRPSLNIRERTESNYSFTQFMPLENDIDFIQNENESKVENSIKTNKTYELIIENNVNPINYIPSSPKQDLSKLKNNINPPKSNKVNPDIGNNVLNKSIASSKQEQWNKSDIGLVITSLYGIIVTGYAIFSKKQKPSKEEEASPMLIEAK